MIKFFVKTLISLNSGFITFVIIVYTYEDIFGFDKNANSFTIFFTRLIPFSVSIITFIYLPKFVVFGRPSVDIQSPNGLSDKKYFMLRFNTKVFKKTFIILFLLTIALAILVDFIPSNDPGGFGGMGTIVVIVFGSIISATVSCLLAFIKEI
jgi:hypothetical protein